MVAWLPIYFFIAFQTLIRPYRRMKRLVSSGQLPCLWCGYALDDADWPQQCPECGSTMTREDIARPCRNLGILEPKDTIRERFKDRF